MSPARFRWGLFLILLGLLLLLRNFNVINDNVWIDLLVLFPVVLIAVGVEKIFARTKLRFISYLTSIGLFVGGLAVAFYGSHGGQNLSYFSRTTYVSPADPDVRLIKADLNLDETNLTIRDSGKDIVYGRFDEFTRKPVIDYSVEDSTASVSMNSRGGALLGGAIQIHTDNAQDWFLSFADDVPLELSCVGNGNDLHLNMSTTPLKRVDIDADRAKIYLKLGELEPLLNVKVFGEDAELRLRVPKTVGLEIFGTDYKNYLETIGLVEHGDAFTNEGYDTLATKVEVRLDDRLGSFSVDFF